MYSHCFCHLQAFAQLLQAPQDDAHMIIKERFPVPRLVVCDQHGSQVFLIYNLILHVHSRVLVEGIAAQCLLSAKLIYVWSIGIRIAWCIPY